MMAMLNINLAFPQESVDIENKTTHHTVVSGDSLYRIYKHYGISLDNITEWNNLQPPYNIHPGQRLWIVPPTEVEDIPQKDEENDLTDAEIEKMEEYFNTHWTYKLTIHPDLPVLKIIFVGERIDDSRYEISSIELYKGDETEPFQTLRGMRVSMGAFMQDINFDGYQDLRITSSGYRGWLFLHFWLFDPKTYRFVEV